MNNAVTRACAWLSVAFLAYGPLATAQTNIETYAGGSIFIDSPAMDSPLIAQKTTVGPDGNVYTYNFATGKVIRLDLATGTASSLPGPPSTLYFPSISSMAWDPQGRLHIATNSAIFRIDLTTGTTVVVVGSGTIDTDIGQIAFDASGNLYVPDGFRDIVRVVRPGGQIERFAGGLSGQGSFSGDGGPATSAGLDDPTAVTVDALGNVYIADSGNRRIRKVSAANGNITTVAGTGAAGFNGDGLPALQTNLTQPEWLAVDGAGNVYINETGSGRIRRLSVGGTVSTVAGNGTFGFSGDGGPATAAQINEVVGLAVDVAGNVYVPDSGNSRLRRVDAATGTINTVLGNGTIHFCGDNRLATFACFYGPDGLAIDSQNNVFLSDALNGRVRKITASTGLLSTIAGRSESAPHSGDGGPAVDANFGAVIRGVTRDAAGNIYIAGGFSNRVRRIAANTGIITTIAGNGIAGFTGDGGQATAAQLREPSDVAVDAAGNIYISDTGNHRIRRIDAATGVITTFAGSGITTGPLDTNGTALGMSLSRPGAIAIDHLGDLLIVDRMHYRLRKVWLSTGNIAIVAGNGTSTTSGNNGDFATSVGIGTVDGLAVHRSGEIYISSPMRIRKIDQWGIITNVVSGFIGPTPGVDQNVLSPTAMEFDNSGRLLYTEVNLGVIRRLSWLAQPTGDLTPPTITDWFVGGTLGNNGWYRSNVELRFVIGESDSMAWGFGHCASINNVTTDTTGRTFSCTMSSYGGTTTRTTTVKRDATAPVITFGTPSPAPNAEGWNSTDVTIPFTVTDPTSGVLTSTPGPLLITGNGAGLTATVTATDRAGNSITVTSPPVNISRTLPTIRHTVTGYVGNEGWYRGNVQINWIIEAGASTIVSQDGCEPITLNTDTAGTTYTCTVTTGIGTATDSVTVKRDATPPTLTFGAFSPAPDEHGWHGSDVSVPYTMSDAMSGLQGSNRPNPLVFTGMGSGMYQDVTVTDVAGNSRMYQTQSVKIDRTPPHMYSTITGTRGSYDWYRSDVRVEWTAYESESWDTETGCETSNVTTDTAGVTFTCTSTSVGGTTTRSVTIRRDTTPPTLTFGDSTPAADANGWRTAPVSVPFETSDATSGVASTSGTSPLSITQVGAGITRQLVVTDLAGNSATFTTPAYNIDGSPPVITSSISGTSGTNDWYRTDAGVTFNVSDPESVILSRDGCDETTVSTDTAGITFTCTAVSAGGTSSRSVTVKRDATPPVLTWGAPSPAPTAAGWYSGDVSIPFTVSDATSGIATTSSGSPVIITGPGANLSSDVVVTDAAGNSVTFTSPVVNIGNPDSSAPVVTPNVSGTAGDNGWYRGNVQVSWSVSDAESEISSVSGCDASTVTEDTAGIDFTCTATSPGGTTTQTVTVRKDTNPPVATFGAAFPAPNAAGWNNSNVSHPYTLTDALSGVSTTTQPSPVTVSAEGTSVTAQFSVTDMAGNTSTIATAPVRIDRTAPTVNLTTPAQGTTYGAFSTLNAQYTCADSLSTPVTCAGTVPSGTPVATNSAGSKTFTVTATDAAGNQATASRTYTVANMVWGGWVALRRPEILNRVPAGSLVPIRWFLTNGLNQPVSNLGAFQSLTVQSYNCASGISTSPFTETAIGGPGLTYSASTKAFTYNWQTDPSWTGCRRVLLNFANNTSVDVLFRFQ